MLEEIQEETEVTTPDKIIKKWRSKVENKNLDPADCFDYFQLSAPYFLSFSSKDKGNDCATSNFDEEGAKVAIIDIIQELILGARWQETFNKLRAGNNVSCCGNIFKNGEPTYSCRSCSADPTCVMCSNCFKKSSHKNHKYKMSISFGGGICDCGDKEAFKRDFCCEDHVAVEKHDDSIITEEMKAICNVVFRAVLAFCVSMLQIDSDANFPDSETNSIEDIFCTLLYNDETHTFDQVITTLTSIVKCEHKDAVEYVTSIDREGRSVVKCDSFAACFKLKTEIEKKGMRGISSSKMIQPLKVVIFHKNTLACQTFALQLLHWFQEFLGLSSKFRSIFCEIVLTSPSSTNYSLRQILTNDIKHWKIARSAWHRLLIAGMLMEYDNKKQLAINFTKIYTNIMQDFLRDDHYHSFSVVSLSVQLFTVPTIAHHLIAHESAFFKLMHTYYAECVEKYIKNKILVFPKNAASTFNKRAHYIITDLRYLLTFKPEIWTQELRLGFLHGIQIMIRLLKSMQGMDFHIRIPQTGHHMEYEAEWESAFTLHIKLSHLITAIIEWCSTDKVILVKVYRMIIAALNEHKFVAPLNEVKELADHSANCLIYDVSSKPVSIHLPLNRFLAGLYIHFEKFNLTFDNVSTTNDKPTPEEIIEPVLCTRTMISQVYSGMWRRNGYSLLNQLFFYRNVKCRSEMLDRDIVILQMGASLIESNEFLIHILNKFDLLQWTEETFKPPISSNTEEDSVRQIISLVDEFLELLIIIVGERWTPGIGLVSEDDRIKKEIIQQLCIKPLSHSELNKALNDEHGHENDIETVINDVAIFEKPTSADKRGVYKLKEEYYNDYNMYFYHYTKEEKSKSEEMQRERHKNKNEMICCPPPILPKLAPLFNMIANLLQSDVMLLIVHNVLKQSFDLKCEIFSEGHLQKILFLIGYAIQEEDSENYPFLKFLERAAKRNILKMMEELLSSRNPRVESQRDFLVWTIKKFKDLQVKSTRSLQANTDVVSMSSKYEADTQLEAEQAIKEKRSKLAAQRKEQILAQMAKAQNSFIISNAEHFKDDVKVEEEEGMEWQSSVEEQLTVTCFNRKVIHSDTENLTCILCSEDSINNKQSCMVYPAFVQKSSVLGRFQVTNDVNQLQSLETAIHPSLHINSCGHAIHCDCFREYFNNELLKEQRRPFRTRNPSIFNIDKNQFLCPLCRFLSNSVLPSFPPLSSFCEPIRKKITEGFNFDVLHQLITQYFNYIENSSQREPSQESGTYEKSTYQKNYNECVVVFLKQTFDFDISNLEQVPDVNPNISIYTKKFVASVKEFAPSSVLDNNEIDSYSVILQTCANTIEALEMVMRASEKPLKGEMSVRHEKSVSGIVRLCGLYGRIYLEATPDDDQAFPSTYQSFLIYARDLYENLFLGGKSEISILQIDVFSVMVRMLFTTRIIIFPLNPQYLIPRGDSLDYTIFNTMFAVNLIKIVLTIKLEDIQEMDHDVANELQEQLSDEQISLLSIYENFNIHRKSREAVTNRSMIISQLIVALKDQSTIFLRLCCIFFNIITGVELPDEMGFIGGDSFNVMADYLSINKNLFSYFSESEMLKFLYKCAQHQAVELYCNKQMAFDQNFSTIIPPIPPVRQLVSLPNDYSDLMNSVSLFTCRNNEREDSRNPTMCLVCGEVLCSQTYCCQKELNKTAVGACNYHTEVCGAGAGIFLRIREAEVLLLGQNTGCFLSAPYLDDYGETDQGLRRGNPLHLCSESYKKLQLLWLGHGIHEEIARKTEAQSHIFQIQWNHL